MARAAKAEASEEWAPSAIGAKRCSHSMASPWRPPRKSVNPLARMNQRRKAWLSVSVTQRWANRSTREIRHRIGRQRAASWPPGPRSRASQPRAFETIEQLPASAAVALDVAGVQVQRRGMIPVFVVVGVQLQRLIEVRDRFAEAAGLEVEVATAVV